MCEAEDKPTFWEKLVRACPIVPYLSLGIWQTWGYIAYGGSGWLSASESTGYSMSAMYAISTFAFGSAAVALCFANPRIRNALLSRRAVLSSGIVAAISALVIVLFGPFTLSAFLPEVISETLFVAASLASGLSTCILGLKCGQLYGGLSPRKAILYVAASYLLVAALYFFIIGMPDWYPIQGGPPLAGTIAFVVLPLAAALLLVLSFADSQDEPPIIERKRAFPGSFWKLMTVIVVFSFIVAAVSSELVRSASLDATSDGTRLGIALGLLLALAFIALAVGLDADRFNFGRLYSLLMVVAVLIVAVLPLANVPATVGVAAYSFVSTSFGFLLWCLLSFVSYQRSMSPILVFGVGYGGFMLGSGLGGFFGAFAMPIAVANDMRTPFCLIFAAATLICAFVLFSEKEFDALFEHDETVGLSLKALLEEELGPNDVVATSDSGDGADGHRRTFQEAVDAVAARYDLSNREKDVLRYLAMGFSATAIAEKLFISWNTVRAHSRNVYNKLGVHSKQELIDLVSAEREELKY